MLQVNDVLKQGAHLYVCKEEPAIEGQPHKSFQNEHQHNSLRSMQWEWLQWMGNPLLPIDPPFQNEHQHSVSGQTQNRNAWAKVQLKNFLLL